MLTCQKPPRRKREPIQYPEGVGGREVCAQGVYGRDIYMGRLYAMEVRQGFKCAICERIAGSQMQFDHQDGRGMNGSHRDDRIEIDGQWHNAALCEKCNTEKGSRRYHWLNGKYVPVVKIKEVA